MSLENTCFRNIQLLFVETSTTIFSRRGLGVRRGGQEDDSGVNGACIGVSTTSLPSSIAR